MEEEIRERMLRRRLQMIFHSQAYYKYGFTLISDKQFDEWAKELANLQQEHPEIAGSLPYADVFLDWDGTTGMHLVDIEPRVFMSKLYQQLKYVHPQDMLTKEQKQFVEQVERGII